MRYLVRISYDGSKFQGFQRLNNSRGVQNELERVLSILNGSFVSVKGAGRTDAKVHALDQCVHFDLDLNISLDKLKYAMNRLLCDYVVINSVEIVDKSFHARYSVKLKKYIYKIYVGEKNCFYADYSCACYAPLSLESMRECCKLFLGSHDFRNFVSGERESYISEILSFDVFQEGDFYIFEIVGPGFYRYMVRSIVGAVLDVGCGRTSIQAVLDSLCCRDNHRFSVLPAQGLYLAEIQY